MSSNLLQSSTPLIAHFKNGLGFILIILFQLLSQQAFSQGKYVWSDELEGNSISIYDLTGTTDEGITFSGYYSNTIKFNNGVTLPYGANPYEKNFIAHADSTNKVVWVSKIAGNVTHSTFTDMAVDNGNSTYISALGAKRVDLYDSTGKKRVNVSLTSYSGGKYHTNGFAFKYNENGYPVWGVSLRCQYAQSAYNFIETDDSGNVYLAGTFNISNGGGPTYISGHSSSLTRVGKEDIILAKYDSSGTYKWHKIIGSKEEDNLDFMTSDGHGNIFLQATITSKFTLDTISRNNRGVHLFKISRNGTVRWAKQSIVHRLPPTLARDGNFYVTGSFQGNQKIRSTSLPYARNISPYVACYDSTSKLKWARAYPGLNSSNFNSYFGKIHYGQNTNELIFSGMARDTLDFGISKAHPYSFLYIKANPSNGAFTRVDTHFLKSHASIESFLATNDRLYCEFDLKGSGWLSYGWKGTGKLKLGNIIYEPSSKNGKIRIMAEYEFPCSGKNYRLQSPAFACDNDSITLRANGGHIVSWYSDTTRIDSGSSSTRVLFNYQASIKAVFYDTVANCVVSKFMETKPFPSPTVKFDTIPISCANADSFGLKVTNSFTGVLDSFYGVGVTGNYFYPTKANIGSNLVYHHFKDSNSCVTTTSANMVVLGLPPINGGADTMVCDGDSAKLTANGANVYEWNWLSNTSKTSSISFLPLSKTLVRVTGTDTNGCSDIDTVRVSVRQLPTVYAGKDTSVCEGKSIQLTAIGAQQYTWMGSSKGANYTVSPTSTSTYYVRGVDSASCLNTDTVLVTLHKNPVLNIGKDTAVCPGATVAFTGKGANTYQWYPMNTSGNTASLVVNINTTVTVVGTSIQGCIDSAKRKVTLLTTNRVNAGLGDTICHGESTTLTASGANSYVWPQYNKSSQQVTISPTQTTYVRVEGTSSNCTTADSVLVVVNPLPNLTISGDSTLCLTESTNLTVSGAKTYQWSNGLGSSDVVTVSPPFTSNYSVTGIDVNGCKSTQSRTVVVNQLPPIKASNNQVVCENTLVLISATGALTYNWSDGLGSGSSHSFSAKQSETYTVEGTDGNGCTNADSVMITVNPLPNVVASPDIEICKGASTELLASGANTYEWADNLGSGPIQKVTPSESTIYVVLGTDNNGCINQDSVRVTVNELPVVTLTGGNGPYCSDDSDKYTLNGSPAGGQFVGPGVSGQFFIPGDAGIGINSVTYLYTDANSCAGSDTLEIEVEKCPKSVGEVMESSFELYPNPNDGTFQVNNKLGVGPFKLNVYNGLGQLVENVQLNGSESQMVNLKVSSGVYLVELVGNDGHRSFQRLVIR